MTKKDYELIARVFNKELTELHVMNNSRHLSVNHEQLLTQIEMTQVLADKLATELKADNRAFDYDRFMNATGVLNNPHDPQSSAYIA
jgi:hypothetical protein